MLAPGGLSMSSGKARVCGGRGGALSAWPQDPWERRGLGVWTSQSWLRDHHSRGGGQETNLTTPTLEKPIPPSASLTSCLTPDPESHAFSFTLGSTFPAASPAHPSTASETSSPGSSCLQGAPEKGEENTGLCIHSLRKCMLIVLVLFWNTNGQSTLSTRAYMPAADRR